MRLLTRYILREVAAYALIGAVLFTFVLFMRDLPKILELVVRDSASLTDVLRIFAYTLPNTLTVTIPTAVLAGILLGLSRLAADSEVTAMRACGIGVSPSSVSSPFSPSPPSPSACSTPSTSHHAPPAICSSWKTSSNPPRPPSRSSHASSSRTSKTTSSMCRM